MINIASNQASVMRVSGWLNLWKVAENPASFFSLDSHFVVNHVQKSALRGCYVTQEYAVVGCKRCLALLTDPDGGIITVGYAFPPPQASQ